MKNLIKRVANLNVEDQKGKTILQHGFKFRKDFIFE